MVIRVFVQSRLSNCESSPTKELISWSVAPAATERGQ